MAKSTRNDFICDLYKNGHTQDDIAAKFEISQIRVGQILRRAGLSKGDRPKTIDPFIRDAYVGVFVSRPVKAALKEAAKHDGKKSVSSFLCELIENDLKRRGIKLTVPIETEIDVPLPLEG